MVTVLQRRPKGVEVHRVRSLDPRDVTTHKGVPVTTVHRTLVDLADDLTPHQLANVIHEAAYRGRFVEAAVRDSMARVSGRRKLHVLERAIELHHAGSAGTKSAGEDAFLTLGFPEPLVNTDLHGFEVDFHWPERGLVVEIDGGGHDPRHDEGRERGPARERLLRAAPRLVISPGVDPLSQSPIWTVQRAFYEQRGGDAFAEIPHEAVDNPWVAAAYARVIRAFGPATIVELGAGAGRFAFNLRRELGDVRYVMTDFAPSQIAAWEANPALEGFEFARYDVTEDPPPGLDGPLVVIANYVFDSLPADAFAVRDGVLEECLVEVGDELN